MAELKIPISDPMSTGAFKSLLNRVVLLPTLVLGVLAAVLAYQNAQLQKTAALVDHSDVAIAHLNELILFMVDEETGVRGYLLGRNKVFLQPYESARQNIPAEFDFLQNLLADDPSQIARLHTLEQAHSEWLQFTNSHLDIPDQAALQGKTRMDAMRRVAAQMLAAESSLRDQWAHRAEFFNRATQVTFFILALIGAVAIGLYTRATLLHLTQRYRVIHADLETSERQFRELADAIPQLAWMAHPDGHIFWYNQRWYSYTGTKPEQMTGWGWRTVHDPELLPHIEAEWRKSISTGQPFDMVLPLRGADGNFRPFLTRVNPLLNDDGRVVRWFGTNTDISAEREAAEALRTSQETLRVALDASNTGTFRWDADSGQFLDVGQNLKRLFGLQPEETLVSTEDVIRLVHHEDLPEVDAVLQSARTVDEFEMEFRVIHPDGTIRWLYDRAKCQVKQPGRIFVGACIDVTQRKLAEDTLRRTEKLAIVGRMASSISHEINNPLAAVTNLLFLIESDDSIEEVRAFAATAEQELARVSQIVTQTLRFHRSAARPSRFDLTELLNSAITLFEPHVAASGVKVHMSLQPGVFIFGNDGELRQVFLNLVGNALDAIRGSGSRLFVRERVRTNFHTGERGVRIVIADDGHGMNPTTARRIFEPFFSTKGESGTGLGLWISEEIVSKHRGSIRVRSSQNPAAHGTVFNVFLPIVESEKPSETLERAVQQAD
jgi:PAS domain S-box-containing protein